MARTARALAQSGRPRRRRAAFTLVEVLATLALVGLGLLGLGYRAKRRRQI